MYKICGMYNSRPLYSPAAQSRLHQSGKGKDSTTTASISLSIFLLYFLPPCAILIVCINRPLYRYWLRWRRRSANASHTPDPNALTPQLRLRLTARVADAITPAVPETLRSSQRSSHVECRTGVLRSRLEIQGKGLCICKAQTTIISTPC